MRPSALLLALLLVALSVQPARAQVTVERPTALEVAAGVTACMQSIPTEPGRGRPFSLEGDSIRATISYGGAPAWYIWRPKASERIPGPAQHVMDGDPLDPPMLISTPLPRPAPGLPSAPWIGEPSPLPPAVVACFDQEYGRLLGFQPPA